MAGRLRVGTFVSTALVVARLIALAFTYAAGAFAWAAADTGDCFLVPMPFIVVLVAAVYLSLGIAAFGRRRPWSRPLATLSTVLSYLVIVAIVATIVILAMLGHGFAAILPVGMMLILGALNLFLIPDLAREVKRPSE